MRLEGVFIPWNNKNCTMGQSQGMALRHGGPTARQERRVVRAGRLGRQRVSDLVRGSSSTSSQYENDVDADNKADHKPNEEPTTARDRHENL